MRICMVCDNYPTISICGASRYYKEVSEKIAEKGIYLDLVVPSKNKKEIIRKKKITIHMIPCLNKLNKTNQKKQTQDLYKYLKKLFSKKKIDLISSQHLNNWSLINPGYSIATNLISTEFNVPNVLTIHNPYGLEDEKSPDSLSIKQLFWDRIICVSNFLSEKVHNLEIKVDNISTCYPGVDLENFKPDLGEKWLKSRINAKESDKIILFAGRLTEAKGLSTLLKAFSIISQGKKNLKLLIAAATTGKTQEIFEQIIEKTKEKAKLLGIKDKIYIQPFKLDEMPHVYNGCDIFVLPTRAEAFGLVFAEAMACKLPVIGTSIGGVPEIIDNSENGYLVPSEDATELAKKINWLLKSKKRRNEMGKKGREKIENKFDLNKTTEKLIGIYKSTICKSCGKKSSKNFRKTEHSEKTPKFLFNLI